MKLLIEEGETYSTKIDANIDTLVLRLLVSEMEKLCNKP